MRGPEFLRKQPTTGLKILDGAKIGVDEPNMDGCTEANCASDEKAYDKPQNPKGTKLANYLRLFHSTLNQGQKKGCR